MQQDARSHLKQTQDLTYYVKDAQLLMELIDDLQRKNRVLREGLNIEAGLHVPSPPPRKVQ